LEGFWESLFLSLIPLGILHFSFAFLLIYFLE
jgi:hypothetical protein